MTMAAAKVPETAVNSPGDDLPTRLHAWSIQEMHFRPRGRHTGAVPPSVDDFKKICRGPMVQVWDKLFQHVRSAQTVRKVKGNLALQSKLGARPYKVGYQSGKQYSQEKADLESNISSLSSEITVSLSNISHLEKDLTRIRRELGVSDGKYKETVGRIHDLRRKSGLLQQYTTSCQEEVTRCEEYKNRVEGRTKQITKVAVQADQDSVYYSKSEEGIESACSRGVRETCEMTSSFLHQLLRGSFSKDKDKLQKERDGLWKHIEYVAGTYSPNQILLALCTNAQDSTLSLHERTNRIDIKKDAERLRFKYEGSGQLTDVSKPPTMLSSVHQLLEESQAAHIMRFIETEKSLNSANKSGQRLGQIKELVHEELHRQLRGNPGALDLAKQVFETEIQLAATRVSIQILQEAADELRKQIMQASTNKEQLYHKYQQIQDFQLIAEQKQNLIRVLAKQNGSAPSRLNSQQSEVCQYMLSTMGTHEADSASATTSIKDSVVREVDKFATIPLPLLLTTTNDEGMRQTVMDLSIDRRADTGTAGTTIRKVTDTLDFPQYKALDCLLQHVVDQLDEIDMTELAMQHQALLTADMDSDTSQSKNTVAHISDLCKAVQEHDERQSQELLPLLRKHQGQATQALTDCLRVKDVLNDWWEQPGQWVVDWVKVDNCSLQHWHNKWTVAITRLRQANLEKS